MIRRYTFHVDTQEPLPFGRAYAFYSCLLSLLPPDYADALHEQGETPISQCLYREGSDTLWRVSLLDQQANEMFSDILDRLSVLPLNTGSVSLALRESECLSAEELIGAARRNETGRFFALRFLTPTAFKQNGKYAIFPDKDLLLQSLLNKWDAAFPTYPLKDEDVVQMLSAGLRISDYNLRTTRFPLKDTRIPGFTGTVRIDTHLSAPLMDVWKILLAFSGYAGVGIKTTLGMGGVMCVRSAFERPNQIVRA